MVVHEKVKQASLFYYQLRESLLAQLFLKKTQGIAIPLALPCKNFNILYYLCYNWRYLFEYVFTIRKGISTIKWDSSKCIYLTLSQTTKFWPWLNWKHLQPTNLMLLKKWFLSQTGKKTMWEKEKMLVTSIFSFSHNVFKSLLLKPGIVWERVS